MKEEAIAEEDGHTLGSWQGAPQGLSQGTRGSWTCGPCRGRKGKKSSDPQGCAQERCRPRREGGKGNLCEDGSERRLSPALQQAQTVQPGTRAGVGEAARTGEFLDSRHAFTMHGVCSMRRGERMTSWVSDPGKRKSGVDISRKEHCGSSRLRSEDQELRRRQVQAGRPVGRPSGRAEPPPLPPWSRIGHALFSRQGHPLCAPRLFAKQTSVRTQSRTQRVTRRAEMVWKRAPHPTMPTPSRLFWLGI